MDKRRQHWCERETFNSLLVVFCLGILCNWVISGSSILSVPRNDSRLIKHESTRAQCVNLIPSRPSSTHRPTTDDELILWISLEREERLDVLDLLHLETDWECIALLLTLDKCPLEEKRNCIVYRTKLIRYLETAPLDTIVHTDTQVDAHFSPMHRRFVDFPLQVVIKREEYSLSMWR